MKFLPIAIRELRAASRRRSTYLVRSLAALTMVALGCWFLLTTLGRPQSEVARGLFAVLTSATLLYAVFSGIRFTADSLSEEKRDGTLGLLFLTDLKGYDVVLGKLAATSIDAVYSILAVLPVLAIPLLLGGITFGEFSRICLVGLNTLFFSLTLGICASAMTRSARNARAATMLLILVLTAILPGIGAWLSLNGRIRPLHPVFFWPSPGYSASMAFSTFYPGAAKSFWYSTGLVHSLGWFALALACAVVPFSWQDRPGSSTTQKWRNLWLLFTRGRRVGRLQFRRNLLNVNPFYWLASRVRLRVAHPWLVLGLLAAGWLAGLVKFRGEWLNEGVYFTTAICLNLLIKGWFASEVSRQFIEERQSGTLELILTTPLTVHEIFKGQRLSLQRQFLGPVLFVLATFIVLMVATLRIDMATSERGIWQAIWVGLIIMMLADLPALFWVGLWDALTVAKPTRAAGNTMARIMALPWVLLALFAMFVSIATMTGRNEVSGKTFIAAWFFFGLTTDILYGTWARMKLLSEFRSLAARRFTAKQGFWARLLQR